jgi:hypothetical protein
MRLECIMSGNLLDDRRRALEEAFFARRNEELRQQLIEKESAAGKKNALSLASGITDDGVLETLASLGIQGDTLAALSLVPLVLVAWADGSMDDKERAAILFGATEAGLGERGAAYGMLDQWLAQRPPSNLFAAWRSYIGAIAAKLTPDAKHLLRSELLARARAVAEAAGGFLGLGQKVSAAEERVLQELNDAMS